MALTITATPDPGTYSVRLAITGGTVEYTVSAYPAGLPDYAVRSTFSPVTGDPTGRVAIDGGVPFGVPTQYVVTDKLGVQASSALVTLDADGPVLSDATDPTRWQRVVVLDQLPLQAEARSVWWTVLGRSDPFVSVAPMLYPGGTLVLYAADAAERAGIRSLITPGNPLLLRSPCRDDLDDVVLLVETATEQLRIDTWKGGPRTIELAYQAVSDQLGTYAGDPGNTYASLLATTGLYTYSDVLAVFRTYADVLTGAPYAGLSTELNNDVGFTAGTGAAWDTFWASGGLTWTWTGSGRADAPGDGTTRTAIFSNSMVGSTAAGCPIPAGVTKVRFTGRVRCTDPGALVRIDLLSNSAGNTAQYYTPGTNSSLTTIAAGSSWTTFVVEVPIAGVAQTVARWFYRVDSLADASAVQTVEWDDLSARWVL